MQVSAGSVSYTHLDVYKRQIVGYVLVSIMAMVLPTTFTYVDDTGATVEATKAWVLNWDKVAPVSYTHLDVYKRQGQGTEIIMEFPKHHMEEEAAE